jgi:hypothetical protein
MKGYAHQAVHQVGFRFHPNFVENTALQLKLNTVCLVQNLECLDCFSSVFLLHFDHFFLFLLQMILRRILLLFLLALVVVGVYSKRETGALNPVCTLR